MKINRGVPWSSGGDCLALKLETYGLILIPTRGHWNGMGMGHVGRNQRIIWMHGHVGEWAYGNVPVLTEVSSPDPVHISLAGCPGLVEVTCGTCGLVHHCMWLHGGEGGEGGERGG